MLDIPDEDLQFQFIRASGPGGQNVNKVSIAVQQRFDLAGTQALNDEVKARLRVLAGRRLGVDGSLLITARNHRTQTANRREALERLELLIEQARIVPRARLRTRPTAASRHRRLESKQRQQRTKRLRGPVRDD